MARLSYTGSSSLWAWDVSKVTVVGHVDSQTSSTSLGGVERVQSDDHGVRVSIREPVQPALGAWDVSRVTVMAGMFQYEQFNQPLGAWT